MTREGASGQSVAGRTIFSSLDVTKGFFQQPILLKDRWKITFVSPHWGHEQLTVAFMGLASSLGSFQAQMERILACYLWKFVCVYIDDIIVFSHTKEEHLAHIDQGLVLLETFRKSSMARNRLPGILLLQIWLAFNSMRMTDMAPFRMNQYIIRFVNRDMLFGLWLLFYISILSGVIL